MLFPLPDRHAPVRRGPPHCQRHHQCRRDRPRSGLRSREGYGCRVTQEDRDGEARAGVHRAHPDTEPGTAVVVTRLEQLVARAEDTATAQRNGMIHVRAASARKEELRREMLAVPIAHLAEVGRAAAREEHELGKTFRFKPGASTFLAFRTAARGMASAAETHREVLAKHGLVAVGAGRVRPDAGPVRRGGGAGDRGQDSARRRHAGARGGGLGDRADRAGDGRPEPAAVCSGRAAAGGVARGEPGVQRTPRRRPRPRPKPGPRSRTHGGR